jgi:chaperonin GroES
MPKIRPLNDKLLVSRIEGADKTPGGIVIPDSAQEKANRARVIAVGPGKLGADGKRHPMDVTAGAVVLLGKWVGSEISLNGEDYLIISEDEVLGIESEK